MGDARGLALVFGGEPLAPLMESPRVTMCVSGEACGIVSAEGCSVPIAVTPVSPALPALLSA